MVLMRGKSTGTFSTELTHESGAKILTMAPKDNGGDGSAFSPTDLCAVSLGACVVTIMKMYAAKHNIALGEVTFELSKEMTTTPPRKIAKISANFKLSGNFSEEEFQKIIKAGKACPIANTLHDVVEIVESFERA